MSALERLGKWRRFFAMWHSAFEPIPDAEMAHMEDLRELVILLRAEVNVLTGMLIERDVIVPAQFAAALEHEADMLAMQFEVRFPGITADDTGLTLTNPAAALTLEALRAGRKRG